MCCHPREGGDLYFQSFIYKAWILDQVEDDGSGSPLEFTPSLLRGEDDKIYVQKDPLPGLFVSAS
jgi:hypothetical protein